MLNSKASQIINLYRFPLAVLVVFGHSKVFGELNITAQSLFEISGFDVSCFIRIFFSKVMPHGAVIGFFLISGYLFFQKLEKWNWTVWRKKINNRVHSLLIPYFLWITLFVLFGRIIQVLKDGLADGSGILEKLFSQWYIIGYYYNCIEADLTNVSWIGTVSPTICPILIPFWFIRDLMFMVALSPIIYLALKKMGKLFISLLLLAYVSQIWPVIPGLSIRAVCFFSLGGYLAMNTCTIPNTLLKLSYVPTIILAILCCVYYDSYLYSFLIPWFVLSVNISLWDAGGWMVKRKVQFPNFLIKASFFIFAFHCFLLKLLVFLPKWNINSSFILLLLYFIVPFVIVFLSVGLYYVMDRWCHGFAKLLTGK